MTMNRWKLVAGVLGLGMCGLAALAEPACRNTAAVNARAPDEKKPEVPTPGRKPVLEVPTLPPPPVVNLPMPNESLPVLGSPKPDFPAVSELPVPGTLPLPNFTPELPAPTKVPSLPKIDPLPTPKPEVIVKKDDGVPMLPPLKMNDPFLMAAEMNKLPPLPSSIAPPQPIVGFKLETSEVVPATPTIPPLPYSTNSQGVEQSGSFPPPPPSLSTNFVPPPITPVADTRPVPTKPLTAAIDPVTPPQLTPRVVVDEPTPLRPVSVEKKLRVQLNLGSGKPWLEIRDNEELVLKVVAEAVEVKAVGEGTEGLNVLKATGGVSFRTLGGNGTCDELRVVPGTGEVQLTGKVVVTSNWGKAETTATAEKMTFRLGSEPVSKK